MLNQFHELRVLFILTKLKKNSKRTGNPVKCYTLFLFLWMCILFNLCLLIYDLKERMFSYVHLILIFSVIWIKINDSWASFLIFFFSLYFFKLKAIGYIRIKKKISSFFVVYFWRLSLEVNFFLFFNFFFSINKI